MLNMWLISASYRTEHRTSNHKAGGIVLPLLVMLHLNRPASREHLALRREPLEVVSHHPVINLAEVRYLPTILLADRHVVFL